MDQPAAHLPLPKRADDLDSVRAHIEKMLASGDVAGALDLLFNLISRLRNHNEATQHRLLAALRKLYGRSSERFAPEEQGILQGILDDAAAAAATEPPTTPPPAKNPPKDPPKKSTPHGRGEMPTNLPQRTQRIPLTAEQSLCPCCQKPVKIFGVETRWYLEYDPGSIFVQVFEMEKGACPGCPDAGVAQAEAPARPIPSAQVGPGMLARILVEKAQDQLPLYRQLGRYKREGLDLADSTLQGWWDQGADKLVRLIPLLRGELLQAPAVEIDATHLAVLDRDHPKGVHLGSIWTQAVRGLGVVYGYEHGKKVGLQAVIATLLPSTKPGDPARTIPRFVMDGEGLIARELAVFCKPPQCCMMHARRYFEKAFQAKDLRAAVAMGYFRAIFDIERRGKDLSSAERQALRAAESAPVLEALREWILEIWPSAPPRTPLGVALRYTANRWMNLGLFVLDGDLPVDTGEAERQHRRIALGRRNYLFAGSDAGAKRLCTVLSLCGCCHMLGLDPWQYLRDVLGRMPDGLTDAQLRALLPMNWKKDSSET